MNQQDVMSSLSNFDLDETDSQIYLSLLKTGEITVGNLAAKLDLDRGKAYRSLNKLRNLGMITTTFTNPIICLAVMPSEALPSLLQKKEHELIAMKRLADQIITEQNNLIHKVPVTETTSFSIIQGRSNIYTRISKLIQEAANTVYMITTIEDITMMYHTTIPEKIKDCIARGIEVRLLTETEDASFVSLVNRLGVKEARIGKLPSKGRMIVESKKQLIMSGSTKNSKDLNDETDSVLHTNSSDMVENIFSLCSHLWKISKPLTLSIKQ
ncbi:MAG: TrmB family transcriptional regulator [Candidatus Nitrosotenuis sp.]